MTVRIMLGDVREKLRELPGDYFDCVVTSPPYWGLRDYGVVGQLGLEPTLGEHIDTMVAVFREVRRVLKKQGTVWLNYGDCYAAAPNGKSAAEYKADGTDDRTFRDKPFSTVGPIHPPAPGNPFPPDVARRGGGNAPTGPVRTDNGMGGSIGVDRNFHDAARAKAGAIYEQEGGERNKSRRGRSGNLGNGGVNGVAIPNGRIVAGGYLKPKDLCMIPNRLAIALQDDGWWVRSEIIWHKPNPIPESVYDRPTTAHEKVWLLSKSEDYYYNHAAIREPVTGGAHARAAGPNSRANIDRVPRARKPARAPGLGEKAAPAGQGVRANTSFQAAVVGLVETRAARNVWTIAPKPFKEAHFATFPPELAERCIKAGVPPTVCGLCLEAKGPDECGGFCSSLDRAPGRVLDPFGGAGTVGLVAQRHGMDATLIELNPEYADIARKRIDGELPAPAEAAE